MNENFKVVLEAIIDQSSMTDVQKKIAKEHLVANLDVKLDLDNFAKQKQTIGKSITDMSEQMKKAFRDIKIDIDDKQATAFAKEFLTNIEKMANATKKLNDGKSSQLYADLEKNIRGQYELQNKLLTSGKEQTSELQRQIALLKEREGLLRKEIGLGFSSTDSDKRITNLSTELEDKYLSNLSKELDKLSSKTDADKSKLSSQLYTDLESNIKRQYDLKMKLVTVGEAESENLRGQLALLEQKEKSIADIISKSGLSNSSSQSSIDSLAKDLDSKLSFKNIEKETSDRVSKATSLLSEHKNAWQEMWNIEKRISTLDTDKDSGEISALREKKSAYESVLNFTREQLKGYKDIVSNEERLGALAEIRKKAESDIAINIAKQDDAKRQSDTKKVEDIKFGIDTEEYSTEMAKINNQLSKYGSLSGEVFSKAQASANSLSTAYQEMQTIFADTTGKYTNEDKIQAEQRYQEKLITTKNLLAQLNSDKDNEIVHMGDEKRVNMINTLNNYLSKNTAMSSKNRKEIEKWIATLASSDDMTVGSIKNINTQFQTLDAQLRKTGQLGLSFKDKIGQAWEKFGGWSLATGALMRLGQEAKKGVGFIKELDDALTDVAYTSDVSKSALKDLGNSSVEMAKDLNTSATNVLDAVKIYSTANASADDIMRKSKPAIMLSNISGMGGAESAKTIQTSLNQFELEDTETGLMDITDTLMYVSGQLNYDFTEGIKEITEGVEASGSVAKSAGLDFQEYAAMVGLAVEQTGQSGSTIGNAYKTIFSRITSASKGQGTLADDLSNAEAALRGIGVQVRDSEKDFRDLTDIMNDIGKVWDALEDSEKAEVGYQVAGTRQLNILNSLFGSWDRYKDVMGDIDDRTGTTLKNQEEYANSLQGHLGEISATVQSIWNNVFDTDQFKDVLKLFNGLLGTIEDITGFLGSGGSLGLGLGAFLSIKDIGTA